MLFTLSWKTGYAILRLVILCYTNKWEQNAHVTFMWSKNNVSLVSRGRLDNVTHGSSTGLFIEFTMFVKIVVTNYIQRVVIILKTYKRGIWIYGTNFLCINACAAKMFIRHYGRKNSTPNKQFLWENSITPCLPKERTCRKLVMVCLMLRREGRGEERED